MPTLNQNEYILLKNFIEQECSIAVGDDRHYLIESRLAKLVAENGLTSYTDLYYRATQASEHKLKLKIIDAMTTNETQWFRDGSPYQALEEHLFPELCDQVQNGSKRDIRIWSAACSSGQEPYSIVMTAHEYARKNPKHSFLIDKLSVTATDISTTVLMLAQLARYDNIAMSRGMLPGYRERYFQEQETIAVLKDEIRRAVKFKQFNLQSSFAELGSFDLIFLRNVAIYFSMEFKKDLFKRLANALHPQGHLFLGASETINGYSTDFTNRSLGRAQAYQVK